MTHPYPDLDQQAFNRHRNLLFSVAYRILGTAADAEDAVRHREQQVAVLVESGHCIPRVKRPPRGQ